MKVPNFKFCRGREHKTTNFFILNFDTVLQNSTAKKLPTYDKLNKMEWCAKLLPYIQHVHHIGMCQPERVGFLGLFGLKTGIHFAHFSLELGKDFKGTTGAYGRGYRFNSK